MSSAVPQIIRCYYHQHPEDYGRLPTEEPCLPVSLRYGRGEDPHASTVTIPEEAMGQAIAEM